MKNKILSIISFYGVIPQLKYMQTEMFEFIEAVINYDLKETIEYEIPLTELIGSREHIEEEYADLTIMLEQFKEYYHLDENNIQKIKEQKIERQLKRIENEEK